MFEFLLSTGAQPFECFSGRVLSRYQNPRFQICCIKLLARAPSPRWFRCSPPLLTWYSFMFVWSIIAVLLPRELFSKWFTFFTFSFRSRLSLCLSQFQLGTSPPGNPGENFFERANPGHPGKFFCLIRCPGAKNDGRIPGGGAKFSQTRRNCSLSLQKKSLKS